MPLPEPLLLALAPYLNGTVQRAEPVGGGCIAHATHLVTEGGDYFLKYGEGEVAQTFKAEAAGLRALREAASSLLVPDVLATEAQQAGRPGYLLMEWITPGSKGAGFWEVFGEGLATLHQHTAERYGFVIDNFIGRLPQQNEWMDDWSVFFREHRLEPQVRKARANGRWRSAWDRPLESFYRRLVEVVPHQPPASILHGDLWGGNFIVTNDGRAALIDPATYFGHREADLAMTELFGGFDARFYDAYRAVWPLEPGYPERRAIYNLYHLVNHLNHFGGSYAGGVADILRRFGE